MRRLAVSMGAVLALMAGQTLALEDTPEIVTDISQGWVKLYENKDMKDRVLTIKSGTNYETLDVAHSDDGKKEFDNQASSAKFQIPEGWKVVLFDHHDFQGRTYELKGTGKVVELPKLDGFDDNASSLRWERDGK